MNIDKNTLRTALVCPALPSPSETFIRAHIERLPGIVLPVVGWEPRVDGRHVLALTTRAAFALRGRLFRDSAQARTTAGFVQAFRLLQPDVVLAEYGDVGARVVDACATLSLPLVVHFHGYDASIESVLHLNRETYPRMFAYARSVIAVSRQMEQSLIALGCPPGKVVYNPYGVDCDVFLGASPSAPLSPPVFLAVGRLTEKKAPLVTIAAFKAVNMTVPESRLRIVGDGPLRESCEHLIRQLRLETSVMMLGEQPPSVVADEMRAARVFVQHSIRASSGDSEGTPVSIIEAGASGLPVVSTRHAGILDVIIDGRTGLLVSEGDSVAMAEAMLVLAKDGAYAAQLGAANQERIRKNFSIELSLHRLTAALAKAVGEARREAAWI